MNRHAQVMADDEKARTLESVLGCLSGAVAALDRAARVVMGNPAFSSLLVEDGVSPAVGCEFVSLLRAEDHWLFYLALEKAGANKRAFFAVVGAGQGLLDVSLTLWRDAYFIVEVIARQASSAPPPAVESYAQIPLRSIFDASGTGLALVSLEGRWLRANGVICTMLGYSEAQLQHTTFMALTHPDDMQVGKQLIEELKGGERAGATLHKRYIHRDGHVVWVRLSVGLVRDDQGQPTCFVSQLEDITENWQLRETLMGSELKFLTLAENSPNIIVRYDRDLLRTYVNPAYLRLTGKTCDAAIGFSPDEEASDYLNQLRRVVATGETAQFVDSWSVANGLGYVSCAVSLMAERSNTGEVVGVLSLAHDITELRRHQLLEDARLGIFEKMATGASLEETLALLVGYLQLALPHWSCRVQLVEPLGTGLAKYRASASALADNSCWSEPIMDKQGQRLGAFELSRLPGSVTHESDIQPVRQTCHIAAIAIERWQSESLLRERERRYRDICCWR